MTRLPALGRRTLVGMVYFERCELRSTDPDGAHEFYRRVLGDVDVPISLLPEPARAAGAPSHWLGHLGVQDVEAEAAHWLARGAIRLGPTRLDGVAILKDPFGSPVALAPAQPTTATGVTSWELHTADADAAWRFYEERCGWHAEGVEAHSPVRCLRFSCGTGPLGAVVETVGKTGAHPHWLPSFPVVDLDVAMLTAERAGASRMYGPVARTGGRTAAIDDPFGAAVGLFEPG